MVHSNKVPVPTGEGSRMPSLVIAAVIGVVLVTVVAIGRLRTLAMESRDAQLLLANLGADSNRLSALEWQAVAEQGISPGIATSVQAARGRMQNTLTQLEPLTPDQTGLALIHETFKEYSSAMEAEFALIKAGKFDEAHEVDEARVDPGYEALVGAIANVSLTHGHRAERDSVAADAGSALILGVAAVIIGILFRHLIRARQAIHVAVAAQTVRREEEERFSALVQNASDAILIVDPEARIRYASPTFGRVFQCPLEGGPDANLLTVVHPMDAPQFRDVLQRCSEGRGEVPSLEVRLRRGADDWFYSEIAPNNQLAHPQIGGIVLNCRDVTERRRAAEQVQRASALAAVGGLAAGVAHNFNNILTVILGRAQLLQRSVWEEEARRCLGTIAKAALDGKEIARRLQIIAGHRLETPKEPVDLDSVIRDTLDLTRFRWRDDAFARGVVYDMVVELETPVFVMGSASELREVFTNLIANGLDAMPAGGRLTIRNKVAGDTVRVSFEDSGVGISPEVRQRLFEPFFTTKGTRGNGLGLGVSRGILTAHGGSLEVDSEARHGAVFTVLLPVSSIAPSGVKAPAPPGRAPQLKLLVIDDEDPVREVLQAMFRALGHSVVGTSSGAEGLRQLEASAFDLVFTDLSMPEMDGWTVARAIRGRFPATRIVLLTGHGAAIELSAEVARLVDAVVAKPVAFADLEAVLSKVCPLRQDSSHSPQE